jgi:hypothetical protein
MANAIPLLEGTSASGGYEVRDTFGATLQNTVQRLAAALALSRVDRVSAKKQRYTVYAGRPTAAFVAEGAAKGVTGAEFSEVAVDIKKIATIVMFTEELIADAFEDPTVLVKADVNKAFADLVDAHLLGWQAGTAITTQFNTALAATTQTVEYDQSKADGLLLAVSSAIATIEANGGTPNGVVLNPDARQVLRDARQAATGLGSATPLFGMGEDGLMGAQGPNVPREPSGAYGLDWSFSTNLPTLKGSAAASRVVGIVGDFEHSVVAMRQDVTVRFTDQASVDVSGTLHHLFQQNKTAFLWEMRIGAFQHDLNRMFVAILNAS